MWRFFSGTWLPENPVEEESRAKFNRAKQIVPKNQNPTLPAENKSKIEKFKAQTLQE